jgi:hypothetical protein
MGIMRTEKKTRPIQSWAASREDWMLMDQDECWFSRFAQPRMHSRAAKGDYTWCSASPSPGSQTRHWPASVQSAQ